MDEASEEPKIRISWVPHIPNSDAPTVADLATGVPLGEAVNDGLQVPEVDAPPEPSLPKTISFRVVHRDPDGTMHAVCDDEPDWIVFRPAADVPSEAIPAGVDGFWLDRYGFSASGSMLHSSGTLLRYAPTGRFETREDGAVAEVFEVRP